MNQSELNKKLGLTLIEILIYVTLLTTVLGLITNFLYQVANFRVNSQIESSLFQNSSLVINKITRDVEAAQAITTPTDENFVNTLVLTKETGQITYQVNAGVLERNGVQLTDNQVEVSLEPPNKGFRKIGNSVQIKISFKAKLKPFGQPVKEKIYQTAASLRD